MRNECHRGGVGRMARTRRGGGDREWYHEEEGWRPHTYDVGVWGRNFLVFRSVPQTFLFVKKKQNIEAIEFDRTSNRTVYIIIT